MGYKFSFDAYKSLWCTALAGNWIEIGTLLLVDYRDLELSLSFVRPLHSVKGWPKLPIAANSSYDFETEDVEMYKV